MHIDQDLVKKIAHLARIKVSDDDVKHLETELSNIMDWVEQLSEVDTDGVQPLTSVVDATLRMRADIVNDGGYPEDIVKNAPSSEDNFFVVPKVVE